MMKGIGIDGVWNWIEEMMMNERFMNYHWIFDYNEQIDRFIEILLLLGVMTRNGLGICGKGSDE